jgi:CRISPR-associated endonuclease/helicase Cas3
VWAKWSKTGKNAPEDGETYHPLICHMLDVATVAHQLWGSALPGPTRERLTRHLGLRDERAAAAWVAFFTGLHDIGKASPGFQDQLSDTPAGETIRGWMHEANLSFASAQWVAHGEVSAFVLGSALEEFGVSAELADQIAALVGGHHGIFPRPYDLEKLHERQQVGTDRWLEMRAELIEALHAGLRVQESPPAGALTPADAMVFAGFVTVADWIGSNEYHFPHAGRLAAAPLPVSLAKYAALAELEAAQALRTVRMDPFSGATDALTRRRTFGELFPNTPVPRDAQQAVIELGDRLSGPALVILEAPMGEGKTEAALYLADIWASTQDRQGMYIALPTQATSNQMFDRVLRYLDRRFADADYVAAHLIYGEAALDESFREMLDRGRSKLSATDATAAEQQGQSRDAPDQTSAMDIAEPIAPLMKPEELDEALPLECEGPVYDGCGEKAGEEGSVIAVEWFAAPKRALVAPYGVGTIDQALLGVLQTKHFFVRLFGLAGKTVIVDEVHAYDTYMSALLDRLLEWLGAFGVPAVLLSATLPRERRRQLQEKYAHYAGWPATSNETCEVAYPRLTWLSSEGTRTRPVVASLAMTRPVEVEWLDAGAPDSEAGLTALGERLQSLLAEGGCAAVICNTVGRAQALYTALQRSFQDIPRGDRPELDLFHARFLRGSTNVPNSRTGREARVLRHFGKGKDGEPNTKRPYRAILVATQVVEQSLDLDFDLMVSDLAPVDLLLQRSGRLHRHRENDPRRPSMVKTPRLIVPRPEVRDGCPQFPHSDEFIYDAHILLRTWLTLQQWTSIRVPEHIEELIEQVYDPEATCPDGVSSAVHTAWEKTFRMHKHAAERDLAGARMRYVPPPKDDTIYTGRNLNLKEEDEAPDAEEIALALTRLGPPSVRAVLLPEKQAQREWQLKGRPPSRKSTLDLLSQSVPISHGAVAPALIEQEPPPRWKKSPWLRHTRLVALDDTDQAAIPTHGKHGANMRTYALKLDPNLGVIIQRQAKKDA